MSETKEILSKCKRYFKKIERMKQFIYLAYYLKNLNKKLFAKFLNFAHHSSGKSKFILIVDSIYSTLRYKISLLEYFQNSGLLQTHRWFLEAFFPLFLSLFFRFWSGVRFLPLFASPILLLCSSEQTFPFLFPGLPFLFWLIFWRVSSETILPLLASLILRLCSSVKITPFLPFWLFRMVLLLSGSPPHLS